MIPGKNKVDYKEILTPEQFAVFARLRELRKEIASREAVPVYTIFTNEQLSQMVQASPDSMVALGNLMLPFSQAIGFRSAHWRAATATSASCSRVVPY